MKIEQIYTNCLAQGAYYIESNGEAAIIDPLREVGEYISRAGKSGAKIKYIFETHFHADFVSGHLDLSKKTGATIVFGPSAKTGFDAKIATDNEEFKIGDITIKTLHTPGHTLESTTWLLKDENGKDHAIFSGDTLFIGDVGRPDLAQKSDVTDKDLAAMLYDSLRQKIYPLANDVIVYPAHGAGSACGKNMSKETFDSLGNQKQTNYALAEGLSKVDFVEELTTGIAPPPSYFPKNVAMNKGEVAALDDLKQQAKPMSTSEFEAAANATDALVLDTRSPKEFTAGHIPNSIFIGLDGQFAPWVGALIPNIEQPILFIAPEGREEEVITRLARVGYDNTIGFLEGGFESWTKATNEVETMESISIEEFQKRFTAGKTKTVDVRKPSEFEGGHLKDVPNLPLDFINENTNQYDRETTYHVHCAGGYRSVIAGSILQARGISNIVNVEGGFGAIKQTNLPIVQEEAVA